MTPVTPDALGFARSGGRGVVLVVVGFDFGTLSSKIVFRAPFLEGGPVFVAKRDESGNDSCPGWLWPARLFETRSGELTLHATEGAVEQAEIKRRLMGADQEAAICAAAYFGAVLRSARKAFLSAEAATFAAFRRIEWELNLGVPSPWADRGPLAQRFRAIAEAGWVLSLSPRISWPMVERALLAPHDVPVPVEVIPELQAGALEYASSHARQSGLHLFLDIGAATVDLAMCRLFRRSDLGGSTLHGDNDHDDVERWSILHADVRTLGVAEWNRRVLGAVASVDRVYARDLRDRHDVLDPMATDIETDYDRNSRITGVLDVAEDQFRAEFLRLVGGAIQEIRTRRDPAARELQPGGRLPRLLMGGGARSRFYRRLIAAWEQDLRSRLGFRGLESRDTPVPTQIENAVAGHGHRMTVALGLSRRATDIGTFRAPAEIRDLPSRTMRRHRDFVDKDQV